MQQFSYLTFGSRLMTGMCLVTLITWAGSVKLGCGESGVDKRVEEFKAGMHKSAPHGEETHPGCPCCAQGHYAFTQERPLAYPWTWEPVLTIWTTNSKSSRRWP
jgi:hypothetical protein